MLNNNCSISKHLYLLVIITILGNNVTTLGQSAGNPYLFPHDIEMNYRQDTTPWKDQTMGVNYSFILDYYNALSYFDKAFKARTYTPQQSDSLLLEKYTPVAASAYILSRADKEDIIIINEAHHNARHRVFTTSLLQSLYDKGYRYLGLEALHKTMSNDTLYPTQSIGYYTQEPAFGNLIHQAISIGFTLFAYESMDSANGKEREIQQAKNIHQFMQSHSDGKYLIHCGYDHVYEGDVPQWEKAMAGRLKALTQKEVFTIDQVKFSERSRKEWSHYLSYGTEYLDSYVLQNQDLAVFQGLKPPYQTDVVVIHPVIEKEGRVPYWWSEGKNPHMPQCTHISEDQYPLQIIAYRYPEYEHYGIPADIMTITSPRDISPLFLFSNEYTIVVKNKNYFPIHHYSITL